MFTEITTIEQVLEIHPAKIDLKRVEEALSFLPPEFSIGMISLMCGQAMTDVLNNDNPNEAAFEPDYNDGSQKKYSPWWWGGDSSGSGFRYDADDWTCAVASASGGARLALKDSPRVLHAKEFFPNLYKGIYLKLKQ